MKSNKFLLAGLAGSVVYFILGWIFYGMLLVDFMQSHTGTAVGVARVDTEMVFWAIALGNLCMGYLLAYILIHFTKVNSAGAAVLPGGIIGLLMIAGVDLVEYGTTNILTLPAVIVDIVTFAVMSAFSAAVIGIIAGAGKPSH